MRKFIEFVVERWGRAPVIALTLICLVFLTQGIIDVVVYDRYTSIICVSSLMSFYAILFYVYYRINR